MHDESFVTILPGRQFSATPERNWKAHYRGTAGASISINGDETYIPKVCSIIKKRFRKKKMKLRENSVEIA